MSEGGARERGTLTLLVQLFGREVLDRLARAGFDSAAAIAAAGADRLASAGGIPLPLAQRVAAVAEESRGAAPEIPKEPGRGKARPHRRTAPGEPAPPAKVSRAREKAAQSEPVVDDVALVAWMGFSSKAPGGRRAFSVADSILDPMQPEMPPEPGSRPEPAPDAESAPAPARPKETAPSGETAEPAGARPQPGRPPATLPGSFWSFGRRPESRPPADAPPRRNRHDH